jgi:uncharacterized protein GlcG (DUF336 family)
MIKSLAMMGAFAFAVTSNTAPAQQGGQQPPARGPQMALALEAAQISVSTCIANGSKVSAAIVDSAGVLRVLLSADGAGAQSVDTSTKKAFSANALKASTSDVAEKMKTDQALAAKLNADSNLRIRPGGLPIMVGNEVIGAIGVGGTPTRNGVAGGEGDEVCAKAGLDKIKDRLK